MLRRGSPATCDLVLYFTHIAGDRCHLICSETGGWKGYAVWLRRSCKNRAMNPARIDFADVSDKARSLICCNLLKAGNCPENPAYRLIRHKVLCCQCFHVVGPADRVRIEQRVFFKPSPFSMI